MRRVAVFALFVVMTPLLLGTGVAVGAPQQVDWLEPRETELEVFMRVRAADRHTDAVERAIRSSNQVRRYAFVDEQAAFREFQRIFADEPEMVRKIRPSDLPVSFRLDMTPKAAKDLARQVRRLPGVDSAEPKWRPTFAEMIVTIADCSVRGDTRMEVFMDVDATAAQLEATRRLVERQPGLTITRVLDHEDAFADFTKVFASQPEKIEGIRPEDLPMSIRVQYDVAPSQQVLDRLEHAPGVDSVATNNGFCEDINALLAQGLTQDQIANLMLERVNGTPA